MGVGFAVCFLCAVRWGARGAIAGFGAAPIAGAVFFGAMDPHEVLKLFSGDTINALWLSTIGLGAFYVVWGMGGFFGAALGLMVSPKRRRTI
jgi:hypothetical protein